MAPSNTNLSRQFSNRSISEKSSVSFEQDEHHQSGESPSSTVTAYANHTRTSNAWQYANSLLQLQQQQSTLRSSEDREEDKGSNNATSAAPPRIGTSSCWNIVENMFILPKRLTEIKARHAVTLQTAPTDLTITDSGSSHSPEKSYYTTKFFDQQLSGSATKATSLSGTL
jgi:hypothetical protein